MDEDRKEYLTKEKFKELTEELDFLKKTKRKEIAEQLEFAKSLGDLSENAEYHEAREVQAITEDRISKLENVLKNAQIVSHKKGGVIEVGSTVVVKKDKEKKELHLVGSEEADTAQGKISHLSPVGKLMMGKKKGDEFIFKTPAGDEVKYKIVSVK
jgi:transcription elongation factor GreA